MKEIKITVPDDYDIIQPASITGDTINIVLQKREKLLPKSWEEFCEMFPIQCDERFINDISEIRKVIKREYRAEKSDKNLLPNKATAEAVRALCQLIQLRNCYNGDWVPDWNNESDKFMIGFYNSDILTWVTKYTASFLYFKTKELRDEFLRCFRDLIEKLKPLYGIKEGGGE